MWNQYRGDIEGLFFKDEIELYEIEATTNEIGETIPTTKLIGTYICNVQSAGNSIETHVSGQAMPQAFRISTVKDIPLQQDKTYKVKIKQARVNHSDEELNVNSWLEAQLSTVLNISRETLI